MAGASFVCPIQHRTRLPSVGSASSPKLLHPPLGICLWREQQCVDGGACNSAFGSRALPMLRSGLHPMPMCSAYTVVHQRRRPPLAPSQARGHSAPHAWQRGMSHDFRMLAFLWRPRTECAACACMHASMPRCSAHVSALRRGPLHARTPQGHRSGTVCACVGVGQPTGHLRQSPPPPPCPQQSQPHSAQRESACASCSAVRRSHGLVTLRGRMECAIHCIPRRA